MTTLSVQSVVALAGGFPVLAGCDLSIEAGTRTILTGGNGAGKTSLLRAIAGLLPIESGSILLDGAAPGTKGAPSIGYLGHAHGLYDELSVRTNLEFIARVTRSGPERIAVALGAVGLTGRLETTPVAQLSAGQRRRAALAVFVMRAPSLWLLDEPHAGLDAHSRRVLDALIDQAHRGGRTIVMSSHELGSVMDRATHKVTMAGGIVVSHEALVDQGGAAHVS